MKIALAGAGAFGEKHLDGLQKIDGVEVISVVGRRIEPTQAVADKYGIAHATTDLAEALEQPGLDAVILCTPTQMHAAQAIQCMDAGKHVQVEIPLCDSLADGEAVLAKAQETGLKVVTRAHVTRIQVDRDGRVTGETTPSATSKEELANMMVGRPVQLAPDRPTVEVGPVRLAIDGLRVDGDRGTEAVTDCSLGVRSGEVVGIAGVSGNGQRELAEAVAGLRPVVAGRVDIDDVDVTGLHPSEVRAAGLAYVPEERMRDGVVAEFSVAENLILVDHDRPPFCRWGLLRLGAIADRCRDLVERFTVKTPTLETPAGNLSGGNIQKLILARELSSEPGVLLASQPTRGVDIGAAEYIHRRLIEERLRGAAVLVISEDLDEVLALSDRIAVMSEGRILAVMDRSEATIQRIGLLMAGSEAAA